jgi:hypothetical protein
MARQYVELYMSHIVRCHGIPKAIISNRGSIFVACFWEQLHDCLGTHPIWSSAYHPQIDRQIERVNQIIEDMLHAWVNDGLKWDKHLPLAEFSYNNSYQEHVHQDVTFWSTLWMTLPYTAELVWVRRKGYLWPRYCDKGRREGEANLCKHHDYPILSKELRRQEAPPLRVWSGWSHIPSSFLNKRCMSLWHQGKASSPLHWSISYHQQVWTVILSSVATIEAIGSS